jgi:hypothetical protein
MPGITSLFRRLGFVKLDRYGLILTPDDRVMSTRPVLDDGLGGKIVGWQEGDLAAMELERWSPGHAPAKPVAAPKLPPRPPIAAAPSASPKGERDNVSPFAATTPVPALVAPAPAPVAVAPAAPPRRRLPGIATMPTAFPVVQVPAPALVQPPVVAPPAEPEEDEWEWDIAMARARAAAEWAQEAADAITARKPPVLPPPDTDSWPKTEPLNEVWEDASSPLSTDRILRLAHTPVVKLPAKPTPTSMPVAKASRTVIPVPELPRAADPRSVRPVSGTRPPPMRIPRATQSRFEETIRTHAATAVNDDATSPQIALPPAPSSSGKRVAAKQR